MNANDKTAALAAIAQINAVEGFDPTPLAVEYTDLNANESRKRLPVMAQMAWFRLKYPEGRIAVSVSPAKEYFVATAKVYRSCMDPVDCYLAEASASRGYLADKPTVSPREWAQTAAVGMALRNAGFGLQFSAAGDSFEAPAIEELEEITASNTAMSGAPLDNTSLPTENSQYITKEPEMDPLEKAMKTPCPIQKYSTKTLGDLIMSDPGAIVWTATKFKGDPEISAAAKLICEQALQATA